jgi:hypothetical protein
MFAQADTNSDGKIDTLELSAITSKNSKGPDAAALMKQIDTNSDGSISETENETFLTAMDDAQKDGSARAAGAASGTRPSGPPPGGGPGGGGGGMAETSSTDTATKVYDKLDTNKDGKVSFEEMMAGLAKAASSTSSTTTSSSTSASTAASATGGVSEADAKELFKKIDANGDGSIDKTEFDSFTKKMEEAIKKQEAATATTYTAQGDMNYEAVGSSVNTIA